MSEYARVSSIEVIREFRGAMWKFAETASVALGDAEGEIQRTMRWLEGEQLSYWEGQFRKRSDAVTKAKEVVRHKKLFGKTSLNPNPSTVDEEKELAKHQRRLKVAEEKLVNVRKYIRVLQKEYQLYKGSVQRITTAVESDVPVAVSRLDKMATSLEAYIAVSTDVTAAGVGAEGSMSRTGMVLGPGEDNFAALRTIVLAADQRGGIAPGDPNQHRWPAPLLSASELDAVEALKLTPRLADPDDRVIIARAAWNDPRVTRIFLHRLPDPSSGDSGWYVGVAQNNQSTDHESLTVGQLLALQPSMRPIIDLPGGTLIVIDPAGIAAMLDASDKPLL